MIIKLLSKKYPMCKNEECKIKFMYLKLNFQEYQN